uniref:CSON008881 protein n=1 Tax=Culicoides sonorensis TaxID=179676 RepID=A0A336M4N9_CULSO
MNAILQILCLITIGLRHVFAANILYLSPVPTTSHFIWNRALVNGLAAQGHNLTVVSNDLDKFPPKNAHYIYLEKTYEEFETGEETFDLVSNNNEGIVDSLNLLYDWCHVASVGMSKSKGFQTLLNYPDDFKFDVVIHDFTCGSFLLGFLEKFNYPPVVSVTAFNYPPYSIDIIGGHKHFAYVPFYLLQYDTNMNFFQRVYNMGIHLLDKYMRQYTANDKTTELMRQNFPYKLPHVNELEAKNVLMLINVHPSIDFPEPLSPNTIPVGGLQIKEGKPLPIEQENFIKAGKKGAILFSLGTMIQSELLGPENIKMFLNAFGQLPEYNFLWKLQADAIPKEVKIPKNVMTSPWISQNDVLANPNVKLFFTHGGLLSTHEASWHGVPMLGLPFHADQFINLGKGKALGISESIDFAQLSTQYIRDNLLKVLNNPSYAKKAKIISKRFQDQPEKPLDRAVWWVEYIIRNPNPEHLQSPVMKMGFLQANEYDIVIVVTLSMALIACFGTKAVCKLLKLFKTKKNIENIKKKQN